MEKVQPRPLDVYQGIADSTRKPLDAVLLITLLVENNCLKRRRTGNGHISPKEICDAALRCDGDLDRSARQLKDLQIETSEDIGAIVSGLVTAGVVVMEEGESIADYVGLFNLAVAQP